MTGASRASRSFRSSAFAAAAALLLACGGELVDTTGQPGAPVVEPAPSVTIAIATAAPATDLTPVASAAIDDTATLYLVTDWKNLPPGAVARLDVRMPGGVPYSSLEIPVGETERGDVRFQVLEDGTRRLSFLLQIWGTPIELQRMTGSWSATATLVGGDASASASVGLE